jgi:hypothetical protein
MVQMELGDFVANSAGYVFWQRGNTQPTNTTIHQHISSGNLKLKIEDKDIPSWAPIRLNTTYWKGIH